MTACSGIPVFSRSRYHRTILMDGDFLDRTKVKEKTYLLPENRETIAAGQVGRDRKSVV